MENILIFLLGMTFGAGMFMGYGWYQINKVKKVKDSLITQIKAKAAEMDQKRDSIKERLVKASELAQAQMSLRAQMEAPSKNALHSKYKNGLIGELQEMEREKLDILKTVLAEGFDPMITIINEAGAKTETPLSAYVDEATSTLNDLVGESAPPSKLPSAKKTSKFILYKGGKDDGTTH